MEREIRVVFFRMSIRRTSFCNQRSLPLLSFNRNERCLQFAGSWRQLSFFFVQPVAATQVSLQYHCLLFWNVNQTSTENVSICALWTPSQRRYITCQKIAFIKILTALRKSSVLDGILFSILPSCLTNTVFPKYQVQVIEKATLSLSFPPTLHHLDVNSKRRELQGLH